MNQIILLIHRGESVVPNLRADSEKVIENDLVAHSGISGYNWTSQDRWDMRIEFRNNEVVAWDLGSNSSILTLLCPELIHFWRVNGCLIHCHRSWLRYSFTIQKGQLSKVPLIYRRLGRWLIIYGNLGPLSRTLSLHQWRVLVYHLGCRLYYLNNYN